MNNLFQKKSLKSTEQHKRITLSPVIKTWQISGIQKCNISSILMSVIVLLFFLGSFIPGICGNVQARTIQIPNGLKIFESGVQRQMEMAIDYNDGEEYIAPELQVNDDKATLTFTVRGLKYVATFNPTRFKKSIYKNNYKAEIYKKDPDNGKTEISYHFIDDGECYFLTKNGKKVYTSFSTTKDFIEFLKSQGFKIQIVEKNIEIDEPYYLGGYGL